MEVLTLMLQMNKRNADTFRFHPRCDKMQIMNLCFADDLFLFSHGSVESVEVIHKAIEEFKKCSGLVLSLPKSTAYFTNIPSSIKHQILSIMPFEEGNLLRLIREFLWCQGDMKRRKAKVKWDDVGLPKDEGGLSIKRLKYWNFALMTKHIWSIVTHKQSIWASWIRVHKLHKHNLWDVSATADSSISWRKILNIRHVVKGHLVHQTGNGRSTSACMLQSISKDWKSIMDGLAHVASRNLSKVVKAKLVFAAAVYFIWQERNNRIFKENIQNANQVFDVIYTTVQLRLLSIRFKESSDVLRLKTSWHLG
ncbi:uncharacterized protein [Rutidosis leptorrhynchoides]|uniref:uncharacterized protein n=1 Tax=Rutidosis leptorrhynchoides TaxID=125765 RepID=UPI003A9953A6